MAERVRAIPSDWVEMRHPRIEKTQRCAPSAVKHWERRGWQLVKAAVPKPVVNHTEKKAAPAPKPVAPGRES